MHVLNFAYRNYRIKGKSSFRAVNIYAGPSLFKNLSNFKISQIEISKEFTGCFQKKKDITMTTDMVVVIADAIDGLKLYLEYIEKVSSNQVQKFFPGSELPSVKSIFQNRINFRLVNFSCKFCIAHSGAFS